MRKHLFLFTVLIIALILSSIAIFAQEDDQGNPNDPNNNDRANACYEEGSMESKCHTEWEWICGWYMIRFDTGIFSREEVPATCASLLPAEIDVTEAPDGSAPPENSCKGPIYGSLYVDFKGSNFIASPAQSFTDTNCTAPSTLIFLDLVYTTGGIGVANTICNVNISGSVATSLGSDIYYCSMP